MIRKLFLATLLFGTLPRNGAVTASTAVAIPWTDDASNSNNHGINLHKVVSRYMCAYMVLTKRIMVISITIKNNIYRVQGFTFEW